jgi:hypothetical protein
MESRLPIMQTCITVMTGEALSHPALSRGLRSSCFPSAASRGRVLARTAAVTSMFHLILANLMTFPHLRM